MERKVSGKDHELDKISGKSFRDFYGMIFPGFPTLENYDLIRTNSSPMAESMVSSDFCCDVETRFRQFDFVNTTRWSIGVTPVIILSDSGVSNGRFADTIATFFFPTPGNHRSA